MRTMMCVMMSVACVANGAATELAPAPHGQGDMDTVTQRVVQGMLPSNVTAARVRLVHFALQRIHCLYSAVR